MKYLSFKNKKDFALVILLTITFKPFFTKFVFPFCEAGKRCLVNIDRIDQHILSPFYHIESYLIVFVINTFVFWYLGRAQIKNPFNKNNFIDDSISPKKESKIYEEKTKEVRLKYYRIILNTTTEKVVELECDKANNENYEFEIAHSNEILEDALYFEPKGLFAIVNQVTCFDDNGKIVGYLDFYESNTSVIKKDQKHLSNYSENKGYHILKSGERIDFDNTSYKSQWTIYYDENENLTSNKTLQNKLERIFDEEIGSTNNDNWQEIIRLEEFDFKYGKRIVFD